MVVTDDWSRIEVFGVAVERWYVPYRAGGSEDGIVDRECLPFEGHPVR